MNDSVQEWFIGFFDVSKGLTFQYLAIVIFDVFKGRNVDEKLICQRKDGTSIVANRDYDVKQLSMKNAFTLRSFTDMRTRSI